MQTKQEMKRGSNDDLATRNSTIIQKVRENVCLYDLSHDDYKNNVKKSNLWTSIALNLGLSGQNCPITITFNFSYEELCYQLARHTRHGLMNVEDPFDLPEVYKLTRSKLRCELFSDRKTGVALFSSDNSLRTAASCKYLAVDATFEVCSKKLNLTIHGLYSGKNAGEWISLAFALMEKKEAASYEMIFNAIKEQWNRLAVWTVFA